MEPHRDEEEEEELLEEIEEDEVPRGWRPSQDTIAAIRGESHSQSSVRDITSGALELKELEEIRLNEATERLRQIEELKPENWARLDDYGKKAALNAAGRELASVYHHPNPPLFLVEDSQRPESLGAYGDGYRLDKDTGEEKDEIYGIEINTKGEADYGRLFGDNPAAALETYAHEFRHSYQREQVNVHNKPQFMNQVDDPVQADEWLRNFKDYKYPPNEQSTDPNTEFDAYWNQPVEQDARDFAQKLVKRVYRR